MSELYVPGNQGNVADDQVTAIHTMAEEGT